MSADQDHLPRRLWWLLAGLTFASVSVTVFSLSMLVIPVVGVISMLFLGERPSWAEYAALALVLGSLLSVAVPRRAARG